MKHTPNQARIIIQRRRERQDGLRRNPIVQAKELRALERLRDAFTEDAVIAAKVINIINSAINDEADDARN